MSTPEQHHKRLLAERAARVAAGEPLGALAFYGQRAPVKVRIAWRIMFLRIRFKRWIGYRLLRKSVEYDLLAGGVKGSAYLDPHQIDRIIEQNAVSSGGAVQRMLRYAKDHSDAS